MVGVLPSTSKGIQIVVHVFIYLKIHVLMNEFSDLYRQIVVDSFF